MAWSLFIAFTVVLVSGSRWRWLVIAHPVTTMLVVVVTANHYWLDGAGAALLLAVAIPVAAAIERVRIRQLWRLGYRPVGPAPQVPVALAHELVERPEPVDR
jgi:hypothetical protein